jgi:hypothetical protein
MARLARVVIPGHPPDGARAIAEWSINSALLV